MVRYNQIEQGQADKRIGHSLRRALIFLTTGRSRLFSLLMIVFCCLVIALPLLWCINNPVVALKTTSACLGALVLFSLCIRLVNKVNRKDIRALLYLIVLSATWLIVLLCCKAGLTEARLPVAVAFIPVGISAFYYYLVKSNRDENDDSDEILFFYLCGLSIAVCPVFFVALS